MNDKNEDIRITLWGMVKDGETFLFRDKACTMPFGFVKSKSVKKGIVKFLDKEYDLIIVK